MKYNQRGFTLIELLVVVLVIGILAAIAVPQYQKAVDRARASEAVQLIASLQRATEAWMLANPGQNIAEFLYEHFPLQLDIDVPCQYVEGNCMINNNLEMHAGTPAVFAYYSFGNDGVTIAALRGPNGTWTYKCGYISNRGKGICEGLQGYEAIERFDI